MVLNCSFFISSEAFIHLTIIRTSSKINKPIANAIQFLEKPGSLILRCIILFGKGWFLNAYRSNVLYDLCNSRPYMFYTNCFYKWSGIISVVSGVTKCQREGLYCWNNYLQFVLLAFIQTGHSLVENRVTTYQSRKDVCEFSKDPKLFDSKVISEVYIQEFEIHVWTVLAKTS